MKTKKKSKFLTFCFSMMPGAAQMYMGFMKMGTSLMFLFFLIIILAMWLNQGAIAACCVIVWFYSFFQANHLAGLGDEDFDAVDDRFLFGMESLPGMERFVKEHNKWIAVLLIFAGGCLFVGFHGKSYVSCAAGGAFLYFQNHAQDWRLCAQSCDRLRHYLSGRADAGGEKGGALEAGGG